MHKLHIKTRNDTFKNNNSYIYEVIDHFALIKVVTRYTVSVNYETLFSRRNRGLSI